MIGLQKDRHEPGLQSDFSIHILDIQRVDWIDKDNIAITFLLFNGKISFKKIFKKNCYPKTYLLYAYCQINAYVGG